MGKALDVVNRFYDVTDNKKGKGMRGLLADGMSFTGPLMQAHSADEYVAMSEKFLQFHRSTRMLKQFENGDHVCSIYEMTLSTPAGGTLLVPIADWIRVSNGRIAEQTIYYDARDFAKAFGM